MHSTSSSRRTAALRLNEPKPPPRRRSRLISAALIIAVLAIAVSLVTSGTVSLGSGTVGGTTHVIPKGDVTVDFATSMVTDDPAAIGVDESTYGTPSDIEDRTAQKLLKKLGVGYARIALTLANPADSTSRVTCAAAGCNTSIDPSKWITVMESAGEVPVAGIPDTLSTADAAAIVKRYSGSGSAGKPIVDWVIGNEPEAINEDVATYDARFNTLYDAMKKAEPQIKIGGPATLGFDQPFLQQFLKDCGSRVDFVDFHFYPAHEDATQLLAELPAMSQDLSNLRTMIRAAVPDRSASIAIHVGEWNFSADPGTLAQYAFTGFASVLDADLLGRILIAGADSLAWGSKNGPMSLLYGDTSAAGGNSAPSGYESDTTMPLYQAIGMFTGQGLFPAFGKTIVSSTSVVSGVDVFAATGPDEIVIVNTNTSAKRVSIQANGSNQQSAVIWQLHQPGSVAEPPVRKGTVTSATDSFKLTLPANSVTTLVMTTLASTQN
jgi:Glycosyl hydrolases family 39